MISYCKAFVFYGDKIRDYIMDSLIFLQGEQTGNSVGHLLHCMLAVQLWDLTLKMLMFGRISAEVRTSHMSKKFHNQPSCLWDGSLVDSAKSLLGGAGCPWQCHCWRFILFSILRKCPAHTVTLLQSVHMNKLYLHFFWSSDSVFRFKVRSSWSLCGTV